MNTATTTARLRTHSGHLGVLAVVLLGTVLAGPSRVRAQDMKPEVMDRVKHAALMVFNKASQRSKGDTPLGSGSGYFINGSGLLVTNNHVVDPGHGKSPAEKWQATNQYNLLVQTVIVDSGTEDEKEYECDLLYTNEKADQALLQALDEDGEKLETPDFLRFLPESRLQERLRIVAFGFPGGDSRSTSKGKHPEVNVVEGSVLEIPRTSSGRVKMIYTDAELRAGNSGGPVVTTDGLLVGTLTLGIANEERRNYNALVPSILTRQFVRYAFELSKIPEGTDYAPLVEMLIESDGTLTIPEFDRRKDRDVLFYEDGDRIYGDVSTPTLTWNSALGALEVPTSSIAYIINNDEGSHLFIEGGNRIFSEESDAEFEFAALNGPTDSKSLDDIGTIAFKTAGRSLLQVKQDVTVLDADLTTLRMINIEGTVSFESKIGTMQLKLGDIEQIGKNEDDEVFVKLRDGRRMTGEFGDDKYHAKLAATGTPIEFGLNEVSNALIRVEHFEPHRLGGMELKDVLAASGREVRQFVKTIDGGDAASVRAKLETMLADRKAFRARTNGEQEQLRLLHAVATMEDGDFAAAPKLLRKAGKADDANIAAYAYACGEVLQRYTDGQYDGKPVTDKATFVAAGTGLANEHVRNIRDFIKDAQELEGNVRGDYFTVINGVKRREPFMRMASIFIGSVADMELVRAWDLGVTACRSELRRLQREAQEKREDVQGRRNAGARLARDLEEIEKQAEKVRETMFGYQEKLGVQAMGFRIEDPDIQKKREREADLARDRANDD